MQNMSSKVECLFGYHTYSKKLIIDSNNNLIYLCTICKRNGHFKYNYGDEYWSEYDDKGNLIYQKDNRGHEYWYD